MDELTEICNRDGINIGENFFVLWLRVYKWPWDEFCYFLKIIWFMLTDRDVKIVIK